MRTMRRSAWAAPLLVVATLLAACGGGGDDDAGSGGFSDTELEHVAAWKANLLLEEDDDALDVSEDEAQCMAEAVVRGIGTDVFEAHDVTTDDISESGDSPADLVGADVIDPDDADAVLAEWEDCVELGPLMAASINSDGTFDADAEACMADELDDGLGAEVLAASFTTPSDDDPPGDLNDRILELISSCAGDGETSGDDVDPDSFIVQALAAGFRESGKLTEEQSVCAAQYVVSAIGEDRFTDLLSEGEDFDSLPQEIQDEIGGELIASLKPCDIPFSALSE